MEGNDEWKRQQALRGGSTTRSFFPAARNALATGARSTPYGGGSGNYGFGPNSGLLSPENNPAYQAAISRPRLQRGDLTTIRTPSGGYATVPSSSAGGAAQAVPGSQVTQIGNQAPINYAAQVAKGYGAPNPTIQGGYQIAGGVANPIENLTPQQRIAGGAGAGLDYLKSNPALAAIGGAFGTFGRNIANLFSNPQLQQAKELNQPTNFGTSTYSQPQYGYNQPRRYFDF